MSSPAAQDVSDETRPRKIFTQPAANGVVLVFKGLLRSTPHFRVDELSGSNQRRLVLESSAEANLVENIRSTLSEKSSVEEMDPRIL